jgi:hypothetical protein
MANGNPTLNANAVMTFQSPDSGFTPAYLVTDGGITLNFLCANPGAGMPSGYSVFVSDAELAAVSTVPQAVSLVTTKLQRKYRNTGIATKLDPLVGQSITI